MVVLGRAASGERFARACCSTPGRCAATAGSLWTDTLRIEGETPTGAGFGAANALATVIGVWDDAAADTSRRPARCSRRAGEVRAGVTLVNGVMVARLLGEATVVRGAVIRLSHRFSRHAACRAFGMFDAASYSLRSA